MTIEQAIEILERHNKWRRGDDDIPETNPKELGEAIDTVVDNFKISTLNASYLPEKELLKSTIDDDINIYAAYDKGKWCVTGYGQIQEPFDTPQEALKSILKIRKVK